MAPPTVKPTPDIDIHAILTTLSLEEKISLLSGQNFWETVGIPSKNIPSLKVSDGPNGARGATFTNGTTAACFPASVLLASTFNTPLVRRIGNALAEETLTKGAKVLLAPTVCPHRHPLGGRNFESFSEDPFLAGKCAAGYINGLQEKGVGATIKHLACNEQETRRFTVDVRVGERALREIYLKPFEIAIREGKPWCVMTSYNLVNGTHSDANEHLLRDILRGEWGWKGLVMSDWGGTNSTAESINAGLDLEMPGPAAHRQLGKVQEALKSGAIKEETIDERCLNILELLLKTGKFEHPETPEERAVDNPVHRKLIREAAGEGEKIAVLGLAKESLIHGGGSAGVNAHYRITPWQALVEEFGEENLEFSQGANIYRVLPNMKLDWTLELFRKEDMSTVPIITRAYAESYFNPFADPELASKGPFGASRLSGIYNPAQSGKHYLGFSSIGPSKVYINDVLLTDQKDNTTDPMGFLFGGNDETNFQHAFVAGIQYSIRIESLAPTKSESGLSILDSLIGFHLGFMKEQEYEEDIQSAATEVAKNADVALIFTGHTTVWETEGQDQKTMSLPANGSQDKLIEAVSSVNQKTIIVNSTGVPILMPWLDKVAAVLQAWFPGQEAGNSIVNILTGRVNPSGRLPVTFPRSLEDTPAYANFPGDMTSDPPCVRYEEGVFIGYRHYERFAADKVLFPFGFGLSYTTFAMKNLVVWEGIARVTVTNTGSVRGGYVVQVYVGRVTWTSQAMPKKKLVGFEKVFLEAGESRAVGVEFDAKDASRWDTNNSRWVLDDGEYVVSVGSSVVDIHETSTIFVGKGV